MMLPSRSESTRSSSALRLGSKVRRVRAGPPAGGVDVPGDAGFSSASAISYAAVPAAIGTTLASEEVPS